MKHAKPAIAFVLLGLLAVGGWALLGREPRSPSGRLDPHAEAEPPSNSGALSDPAVVRSRNSATVLGDAGLGSAGNGASMPPVAPSSVVTSGPPGTRLAQREAERNEAGRSAGWRLGRRRREVEMLDARVERLSEVVARLRTEGRDALADRQQSVVERIRIRADDMRGEVSELQREAEADGTLAEAEQSYEEAPLPAEGRTRVRLPDAP